MLTPRMKRRIRHELSQEKPTVWVGKEGVTSQIVDEISKQLERREVLKGRILKTALKEEEARSIAAKVAQQTESTLVDVRGHTFAIYKRRKKRDIARQTV